MLVGGVRESSRVTDAWPVNRQEKSILAAGLATTEVVMVCRLMEKSRSWAI